MSFGRRMARIARGVGRSVTESLRLPGRAERDARRQREQAEAEARAEAETLVVPDALKDWQNPPAAPAPGLPDVAGTRPERAVPPAEYLPPPTTVPAAAADDAVVVAYAVLGLPAGANLGRVESAYRRLKERYKPEQFADDAVKGARARQQDARLDEAYHTLRQALVRERRL